jgi:hypothetical protein
MKLTNLLPVVLLLTAYFPAAAQTFSKQGVSFTLTSDWVVTEEEDVSDGKGYYLAAERSGVDESGLITVTWTNVSSDLIKTAEKILNSIKINLKEQDATRMMFGEPETRSFGKYKGIGADYTFTLEGIPHQGTIYTFTQGGKTIMLMCQEAVSDAQKNKAGFEKFKNTFTCR